MQENADLNSRFMYKIIATLWLVCMSLTACSDDVKHQKAVADESITLHESVQVGTDLDVSMLNAISKAYKDETGIKIEWIPIKSDIFSIDDNEEVSLQAEIALPKGLDMLLMHSAYTLDHAKRRHILQPIGSEILATSVPIQYQDVEGYWFGVGMYARTLVYNKNKVNKAELINYAGLADDKWYGRLCMTDIYTPENQAIAKMMLAYRGSKITPDVLRNWQRNMGSPSASNEAIINKIEQGQCDVGIVDSDVYWHYAKQHPQTSVRMMWANQINRGTITNVMSAGLLDAGEDVGNALRFIEWLASDEGQALLAFNTSTFPVVTIKDKRVNVSAIRPEWSLFEADTTPLSDTLTNRTLIKPSSDPVIDPQQEEQSQSDQLD